EAVDPQGLVAAGLAAHQTHPAFGNAEELRHEADQLVVGLAVHRRRRHLDLQPAVVQPDDGIPGGPGLDVAVQQQPAAAHLDKRHGGAVQNPGTAQPGSWAALAAWVTKMRNMLSTRNTRIGDRSRPPRLGTILRNGAITGSISCHSRDTAGCGL